MCETYGSSWVLTQAFLIHFMCFFMGFTVYSKMAEKKLNLQGLLFLNLNKGILVLIGVSAILQPPLWEDVRGLSANRVGDVRPHRQGVEGIKFPWFPHLRRTEAREQCEQHCLRAPVVLSSSFFHSRSQLQSHLFLFVFVYSVIHRHSLNSTFLMPPLTSSLFLLLPAFSVWFTRHYHMQR